MVDSGHIAAEPWPEHWLPRKVAATGRVVLVGHQRYHQLVVSMDDGDCRGRLRALGYRLSTVLADPQDPQLKRRGVYQRRVPDGPDEAEG